MKRLMNYLLINLMLFSLIGCSQANTEGALYQVSTLQALIVGEYDGEVTADTLDDYGDIGLGTFDGLDGEMIVIDGKIYKAKVDGSVTEVSRDETIPFANVAYITNNDEFEATFNNGYDSLKTVLDSYFKEANMPVVFSVSGDFVNIEYRSVPEQEEPYQPLTEVVADQTIFFEESISGTLVGFRFPEFMNDMNATGYHLHFISDDRTKGGHLLNVDSGTITITGQELESFYVVFPDNIRNADLNIDEEDVEAVEKK